MATNPVDPGNGEAHPERGEISRQTEIVRDHQRGIYWQFMAPEGRPCFNGTLLNGLLGSLHGLEESLDEVGAAEAPPFTHMVTASRIPGVFNLGGDLFAFAKAIRDGNKDALTYYAQLCVELQYRHGVVLSRHICPIALVQGDALGGGFECALSAEVIIAERSASFGLPECLFGLFPGMGAYDFLSRRLGPRAAEGMIMSGQVFSAEEMHAGGIVDILVDDGEGVGAVHEFVRRDRRQRRTRQALRKVREAVNPITREQLLRIADIWVETALSLGDAELRKMERLVRAQDRRQATTDEG